MTLLPTVEGVRFGDTIQLQKDIFWYMMRVILQVLIAGWDEQQCKIVYRLITQWLNKNDVCVTLGH